MHHIVDITLPCRGAIGPTTLKFDLSSIPLKSQIPITKPNNLIPQGQNLILLDQRPSPGQLPLEPPRQGYLRTGITYFL